MTLAQLRNMNYTLDDPLLNDWLQSLGNRMGAASDKPEQRFTVFLLRTATSTPSPRSAATSRSTPG